MVVDEGAKILQGKQDLSQPHLCVKTRLRNVSRPLMAVAGMVEVGGVFDEAAADGSDADVGGWDPAISAARTGAEEAPAGAVCSGTGGAIGFSKAMRELEAAAFAAIAAAARPGPRALTLERLVCSWLELRRPGTPELGLRNGDGAHGLRMPARLRPSVSHGLSSDPELRIVSKSIESRSIMGDGGTPPGACAPCPAAAEAAGSAVVAPGRGAHEIATPDGRLMPRRRGSTEGERACARGARPCEDEPCTRAAPRAISGGT